MTVEEIIRGESKNTEFKEMLPKDSVKYTKTVVAYANTQGGKIFFGVVDETREIAGIDEAVLFQSMDSIANAVADSCEPQIVPDIEPCTIDGRTIIVFLDKREYTGPVYEQVDEAINFVLRNIRLGARIEGIQRKESYELPVEAIREMIVNAQCHRNMADESCVQVAIYDDRLEVTSPGGLYNGLTFAEALQGHSKLRNRAIANVFSQIGLIEAWGTGLQRIQNLARAYGLPDVEFIEMPETFRVNLYRKPLSAEQQKADNESGNVGDVGENIGDVGENISDVGENIVDVGDDVGDVGENIVDVGENISDVGDKPVNAGEVKTVILHLVAANNRASASDIAQIMSVTSRTVERYIRELREEGLLVRHGSARGGYWEVRSK